MNPSRLTRTRILVLSASCLPPTALLGLILWLGVDVPFWDQWVLVPILEQIDQGRWPWADFWHPHNEHRLFFPQMIMAALAQWTGWNPRFEMAVIWLLAVAGWAILQRGIAGSPAHVPAWLLPLVSLWVFHPSQWENWAWGWQIQVLLNVFAVIAGFFVLQSASIWRWPIAVACGVVATFSFANGLLFWPLVWIGLAIQARGRGSRDPAPAAWTPVIAWTAVSVAIVALFFHGFEPSARPPFFEQGFARTLKLLGGYLSIYLSAPLLGFHGHLALYGGFLSLCAVGALLIRTLLSLDATGLRAALPWLQLMGYAVASGLLTAVGRLHLSLGQALSSRYLTISTLFWISAAVLLCLREPRHPKLRRAAVALGFTLLTIHGFDGISRWTVAHEQRGEARTELVEGGTEAAKLEVLYPDAEQVMRWREDLKAMETGPFRPSR